LFRGVLAAVVTLFLYSAASCFMMVRSPFLACLAWPLALVVGGGVAWLSYRRDIMLRWKEEGCCLKCGYSLTGNVSGRCPECGAAKTSPHASGERDDAH